MLMLTRVCARSKGALRKEFSKKEEVENQE